MKAFFIKFSTDLMINLKEEFMSDAIFCLLPGHHRHKHRRDVSDY